MKKIPENAILMDVRTPQEYAQGHYPGAVNIPLDQIQNRIQDLKKMSAPIVAYCRSGNRSGMAVSILKQSGFNEVYNAGGLADLPQQTK